MNLTKRLRDTWNLSPELMLEAADELEKLTAERDALRTAAKLGLDALKDYDNGLVVVDGKWHKRQHKAITALRGVLGGQDAT